MDDLPAGLRPNTPQLSRRWLTVSLIAVTLVPVAVVLSVWFFVPDAPEPALPATVEFRPVTWPPGAAVPGSPEVQLVPAITITNTTEGTWRNISLSINKQFYFYYPEPLPGHASCDVPLFLFRTSGNQSFRPRTQVVKLLTIYAQLPSGGRAIYEGPGPALNSAEGNIRAGDSDDSSSGHRGQRELSEQDNPGNKNQAAVGHDRDTPHK